MSKSKEEIEIKVRKFVKDGFQHDYNREDKLVPVFKEEEVIENILMEMDQFAKSQCIAFAKYENTEAIRSGEDHWKHRGDNFKESITTDQLYDLFIQHQSQQG